MYLIANTIIDITSLSIVILIYLSGKYEKNKYLSQYIFNKMLFCISCYFIVDWIAWCIDGKSFNGCLILQMAMNTIIFLTQVIYSFLWLIYADYWVYNSRERINRMIYIYAVPMVIEIILLIVNIYNGWIFSIDENQMYVRGSLFLPCILFYYIYDIVTLYISIKAFFSTKDRTRKIYCLWMSIFMMPPAVASLVLVMYVYGISVTAPFYAISVLMIYLNVQQRRLREEEMKLAQREVELQRANVSIMLSQIQPHFLYNTLNTIKHLCAGNPKAQDTVVDFARYLRGNMDSLVNREPIPFLREMEHLRNYLNIEKTRFPDIEIAYELNATGFMIPALSVQPLVENAICHGVTCMEAGGTIRISSFEREEEYLVCIEDDGCGFDTKAVKADGRSHIGISNVRGRLNTMCAGSLDIESEPGVGTKATIHIPK